MILTDDDMAEALETVEPSPEQWAEKLLQRAAAQKRLTAQDDQPSTSSASTRPASSEGWFTSTSAQNYATTSGDVPSHDMDDVSSVTSRASSRFSLRQRTLIIKRKVKDPATSEERTETEIVRNPKVIRAYLRHKQLEHATKLGTIGEEVMGATTKDPSYVHRSVVATRAWLKEGLLVCRGVGPQKRRGRPPSNKPSQAELRRKKKTSVRLCVCVFVCVNICRWMVLTMCMCVVSCDVVAVAKLGITRIIAFAPITGSISGSLPLQPPRWPLGPRRPLTRKKPMETSVVTARNTLSRKMMKNWSKWMAQRFPLLAVSSKALVQRNVGGPSSPRVRNSDGLALSLKRLTVVFSM